MPHPSNHQCLKTGAVVHFPEYGCVARCDIHQVSPGGDLIVKLGAPWDSAVQYLRGQAPFGATHEVCCIGAYVRKDLGLVFCSLASLKVLQ